MQVLRDRLARDGRLAALTQALRGNTELVLGALHGSFPALLLSLLPRGQRGSGLIVTPDPDGLAEDLDDLGVASAILPELDEHEEAGDAEQDRSVLGQRLAALEAMAQEGRWLLATPRAAEQPVPRLADLAKHSMTIAPGDRLGLHHLAEYLANEGYQVAQAVEAPGQLAQRGGVVDVYPYGATWPLRIEFFDEEVETIRRFDPLTQESVARLDGAVIPPVGRSVLATERLWAQLPAGPIVVLGDVSLRSRLKREHGRNEVRLARVLESGAIDGETTAVERLRGDEHRGFRELSTLAAETRIIVLARNQEAAAALGAHLREQGVAHEMHLGRLAAGWRDLAQGQLVVHDFELAHRQPVRRKTVAKVAGGSPLSGLADLKAGDYVVHLQHGIARFKGMATLERRGYLEDFLLLEFAEESRLYVPVSAIELIQKYVGGAGRHPELDRIGSAAWAKRRQKAEKAIADLAGELLEAAAARAAAGGLVHPADGAEQRRFEAAFPYEETEDQLSALREIKADLERPRAMDRLLCGDVGFGKTELALRAAFKVVQGGKQVALLAPTTLLSEQHYATFAERGEPFGLRVACMNRFRSTAERRDILARVGAGEVDILIGTHALLGDGLRFAELGLLIVDEEQRFGVRHKEKLKALRQGVDLLTLTATPIPRTLHQGMVGLREVSVLAEAPANRMAVETRLVHWDKTLLAAAMRRELDRGGQCFVVHNRVEDIEELAGRLARMVGEMSIEVIHGQMDEERIAATMRRFKSGGLQCLVATAIVESGIDIPNANTMIVNNAHAFGLAELHQLRGRIGRFSRQAYCYLVVPQRANLGREAAERLDAIQEYAELGAGFKLAMRDLELRGAGNLLGGEQSGHIAAIGYELYCRLLHEAVRKSGGAGVDLGAGGRTGAALAFPADAWIPDEYCESPARKFELHKSLDDAADADAVRAVMEAARDRYGPPPPPVRRLAMAKLLRLALGELGVTRVASEVRQLTLELAQALPPTVLARTLPGVIGIGEPPPPPPKAAPPARTAWGVSRTKDIYGRPLAKPSGPSKPASPAKPAAPAAAPAAAPPGPGQPLRLRFGADLDPQTTLDVLAALAGLELRWLDGPT
jgi:transcription-repair coupling factor (superfamily II helicase)